MRAVLRRPRILILDEATSALDVSMRDRLFAMLERLRGQGVGVIFITHRMDEIVQIGDRVTVMRSGRTVTTLDRQEVSPAELVRLMTGGDQLTEHQREGVTREAGRCVLRTNGITLAPGRAPIDFELRSGELVGVAGLEGHGQEAFLDALRGVRMPAGEVAIESEDGGRTPLRSRRHAAAQGIAYVPRERRQATFAWMSIVENFGMPTLRRDSTLGWLAFGRTRRRLEGYVDDLSITVGDKGDRITTLSGGNMQKVVIARWLASEPRVLLLNDPTRGIDIGAKRDLYSVLLRLTADGIAVVMLSTEVDEHIELMDRVLVFREHQLFCELERSALGRDSLVSAFFGRALAEA